MRQSAITLEQVLAITYFSGHTWAPDGERIAYILDDGGRSSLCAVEVRTARSVEISEGQGPVTTHAWARDGRLGYIQGGRLVVAERTGERWTRADLYAGPDAVTALEWSPVDARLAFVSGGRLWLWDPAIPTLCHLDLPGRVSGMDHQKALGWAPDGSAITATFQEDGRWDLAVVDPLGGLRWRSYTENLEGPFTWLRGDRLLFARPSLAYTVREWCVLDLPDGSVRVLHHEDEPEGLGATYEAQAHPDGRHALLVLRHDGWWHLHLLDTEGGGLRALTGRKGEDVGHAYDLPRISPDGREVIFSTNRENLGMRHLFAVDLETASLRLVVDAPGTSVEAAWSPDGRFVAFRHSTVRHAPELWVVGRDGKGPRRLVGSMPDGVDASRFALPQPMAIRGAGDLEIPGYLLTPPLEAGRRYPALLYIHGGGMRQMREGFPPLKSYAFFYAVSLWLADRGVVSYLVNYRGGIGYGKAFEQGNSGELAVLECDDCVRAGEWLKTLPFVDPRRVGVWGLSYGGWLTLASLVRAPEVFALGINFAGIWDFGRWMDWARTSFRPAYDYFLGRARGSREESPEIWRNASPRHLVARMRAPLVNFHGTKDANVPFEQLDLIVKDCVEHERDFTAHYYPEETHLFTHRATWRDALRKVEDVLRAHLGYVPEGRGDARGDGMEVHSASAR
jgi:dipeptidyl aminopeptidase/acylaminoacyl peptidase